MRRFALLFIVATLCWLNGCDNTENSPVISPMTGPGTVSGSVQLDPQTEGTVDGAIVQLYSSSADAAVMRATLSQIVDQTGQFTFANVPPGQYYIGAWKDNDGNGILNSGDLSTDRASHQSCECQVACGCGTQICPCMCVVP